MIGAQSIAGWGMRLQLLSSLVFWIFVILACESRIGRKTMACAAVMFVLISAGTLEMVTQKPWRERRCLLGQEDGTGRLLIDFLPTHDGMDVTMTVWDAEHPEVKKTKSLHSAEWQHLQYHDYGWESDGIAYLRPEEGRESPVNWRMTLP